MTFAMAVARAWLTFLVCLAVCAPWFTPYRPAEQFRQHVLMPPMSPQLRTARGEWTWPFVDVSVRTSARDTTRAPEDRPKVQQDDLQAAPQESRRAPRQAFGREAQPRERVPLHLGAAGTIVHVADPLRHPWFPLGTDHLGRDVWTRLVYGSRLSLSIAIVASVLSVFLGVSFGALAAWGGRVARRFLDGAATCTTAVPLLYLVVFLRALLPLSLSVWAIMLALIALFALAAWPSIAVGVRTLLATELTSDYVAALRASGASPARVLWRAAPAVKSFVITQLVLWMPAFIVAESTLSFVGWGFPPDVPSWGTLLQDADDLTVLVDYPWLLASAVAIASVSLAINAMSGGSARPARRPI